jgi:hypothetical protein
VLSSSNGVDVIQSFEPVLNVPQLGAFLFIAIIFVMLQLRIRSIEDAAQKRTIALDKVRKLKTQSLSSSSTGQDTAVTSNEVMNAIDEYRQRYEEVERLRELIPGIRIVQPPSQTMTRQRMDDNIAGAQQFLGIVPEMNVQQQQNNNNNDNNELQMNDKNNDNSNSNTEGLTILQQAAIVFILVTQCSLFFLLLLDPMSNADPFR